MYITFFKLDGNILLWEVGAKLISYLSLSYEETGLLKPPVHHDVHENISRRYSGFQQYKRNDSSFIIEPPVVVYIVLHPSRTLHYLCMYPVNKFERMYLLVTGCVSKKKLCFVKLKGCHN